MNYQSAAPFLPDSGMNIWIVLFAGGIITYLIRLSFILLLERKPIHPMLSQALRLVPAAVLSAIIAQEVLTQSGKLAIGLDNPRVLAAIAATLVAWRTKSVIFTILVGMSILWLYQAIF